MKAELSSFKVITFFIDDDIFAIDILKLKEIVREIPIHKVPKVPAFVEGIINLRGIVVPIVDTLRVMTIRIYQKKSPFSADNNHIHHRLLVLVPSHLKVTIIILSVNMLIIALAYFLNQTSMNVNFQFLIVFFTGIFFSFIPSYILKMKSSGTINNAKQINLFW